MQLSFKDLPFTPEPGQVIYIESSYNEKWNQFISKNYEWIQTEFKRKGFTFCYLPVLAEQVLRYNAPHLTEEKIKKYAEGVSSLIDFAVTQEPIEPSLVFATEISLADEDGNVVLHRIKIDTGCYSSTKTVFYELFDQVSNFFKKRRGNDRCESSDDFKRNIQLMMADEEERFLTWFALRREPEDEGDDTSEVRFSVRLQNLEEDGCSTCEEYCNEYPEREDIGQCLMMSCNDRMPLSAGTNTADNGFDIESSILIDEIRDRIAILKQMGVNTLFLQELIDEQPKLSRLRITKDYRIYLVDYNDLEIQMSMLPKAVFFLFLRHPEGFRFKELSDYTQELLEIYEALRPNGTRDMHLKSVQDVTDSTKNSINEKCARIREAFVKHFDEKMAQSYFVTGKRGEPKSITLDRNLVIWD